MTIMLRMQADRLLEEWNLEFQVYGVTDSRWMLLSATPIDLSTWQSALDKQVQPKSSPLSLFLSKCTPCHWSALITEQVNTSILILTGDRGQFGLLHIPLCQHPASCREDHH